MLKISDKNSRESHSKNKLKCINYLGLSNETKEISLTSLVVDSPRL